MKIKISIILYPYIFLFFLNSVSGQNLSQQDLRLIADGVNTELKGRDIGNGVRLRECIASSGTLSYYYEVPELWSPSPTLKEDLITNFKAIGILNFYKSNRITIKFFYFNGEKLVQKVEINNKTAPNFELGEYVNLNGHPKGKDVNLKLKSPKNWEVLEGDRPNVVKKFVEGTNIFLVLIKDNATFFSRREVKELLSDEEFTKEFISETGSIFENYLIHNQRIITIDTYPAFEFTISGNLERSGIKLEMRMKAWLVFYEDKIVHFQASGLNNESFDEREQHYTSIINSVIFSDQYNF